MIERIPARLLPSEAEILDFIDGRKDEALKAYLDRIRQPYMSKQGGLCMFLDGLRQLGLLKHGERLP